MAQLDALNARGARALDEFADSLAGIAGISLADARKVSAFYRRHKIAKVDFGIGRVQVKHGAYLEADVIRRALATA